MTTNAAPAGEEFQRQLQSLKSDIDTLRGQVALASLRDQVSDLHNGTLGLGQRLKELRGRNYVFEKTLEARAEDMGMRWGTIRGLVDSQLISQSNMLQNDLRSIDAQLPQLMAVQNSVGMAQPLYAALRTSVDGLESRVSAAQTAVTNLFEDYEHEYRGLDQHLDHVTWALDRRDEATFQLLPAEGMVMAVEALWAKDGKEDGSDPKGILYLTDQRIIFEQKEEIVTKKVLFVATEKQKVQKLQIECPVSLVDKVDASKQGMLKNEDHIEIRFASGAPVEVAHFHIWQDNATWQQLINRAKSKDFDNGRAVAIDQAVVDKVKAAPAQCPNCGGNITQVVMRGMDSIKCEYCGFVIRL